MLVSRPSRWELEHGNAKFVGKLAQMELELQKMKEEKKKMVKKMIIREEDDMKKTFVVGMLVFVCCACHVCSCT
jgi:hypothetical protein